MDDGPVTKSDADRQPMGDRSVKVFRSDSAHAKDLFIEPRLLVAYGLIVLIVSVIVAAIFYARHTSYTQVDRRQRQYQLDRQKRRETEKRGE
ncbi:hypothetical protein [Sphingomonas ursincola]|uniref:Uncharacterized protein n=1 Tax=Sphingomonas ursincola TaxID=56361 RepID=A0A7V8RF41_9SPHN|nr:hypothetical protein [Sphingomonas ursincola]MBA1375311.1 hypothetical protein [Sphingomonas ursincola]